MGSEKEYKQRRASYHFVGWRNVPNIIYKNFEVSKSFGLVFMSKTVKKAAKSLKKIRFVWCHNYRQKAEIRLLFRIQASYDCIMITKYFWDVFLIFTILVGWLRENIQFTFDYNDELMTNSLSVHMLSANEMINDGNVSRKCSNFQYITPTSTNHVWMQSLWSFLSCGI